MIRFETHLVTIALIFTIFLSISFTAQPVFAEEDAHYVCPMHCKGLEFDEPGTCPVCEMHLVLDGDESSVKSALMPGIGSNFIRIGWLLFAIFTLVGWRLGSRIRLSNRRNPIRGKFTFLRNTLTRIGKSRWVPFIFQFPLVLSFLFIIFAGLFGNQEPGRNIALVLTWNIWWMGLTFFAFFLGSSWCTVCPWMAIPDWFQNLLGPFRRESGGNWRWPKPLRNLYPAVAMLLFISWLELAYDAPNRPAFTAWMGVGILAMATLFLVFFERKTFCRYVCPVGRATGAYSLTGFAAIRRIDNSACQTCLSMDCYHGNEKGLGCPTFEFMGALNDNMYCTMCTECLKTCPKDNIEIHLRAPFSDLFGTHRKKMDEAVLILAITSITVFHGLSMIPFWKTSILDPFWEGCKNLGLDPGFYVVYTITLLGFLASFFALYAAVVWSLRYFSTNRAFGFRSYFVNFSYATLPIALGYHLAHNALHLFYEGSKAVKLASDPMGWGWDLFGTADMAPTMLVPMPILFSMQLFFLLAGHTSAVAIVGQITRKMTSQTESQKVRIPMILFFILLTGFCFWLLSEPMEMRTR